MQNRTTFGLTAFAAVLHCLLGGAVAYGQASSTTYQQTVNQAPTVTEFQPPKGIILPGQNVTLTGLIHSGLSTTGIQSPTQTVTFTVNGTNIGSGTVTPVSATNLLPYSEAFSQWSAIGTTQPVVTDNSGAGPWANGNTATSVVFPSSGALAGFQTVVSGTNYAGQQLTFSVWLRSPTPATLVVSDGSGGHALAPITIPSATSWQRFATTFAMPADAATGVTLTIEETASASSTVNIQGAQLEAASSAGVYVKTAGASATGSGGIATTTYAYTVGSQTTATAYSGDSNYLGSTSPDVHTVTTQAAATVVLVSSLNASNYGQPVTFTATVTGDNSPFATSGVVTINSGATVLATCNATVGTAPWNCQGTTNALPTGTDSITATYAGDANYSTANSNAVAQVVNTTAASLIMTSTTDPSTYGQNVTYTITMTGVATLAIPSGTATVVDNGACTSACTGGTTLGGGALTLTNGVATFSNAILTGGQHNLVITYGGDLNYR